MCSSLVKLFRVETPAAFRAISSAGLHNLYGPTEAAVSITNAEVTTADIKTVPIGVPQSGTRRCLCWTPSCARARSAPQVSSTSAVSNWLGVIWVDPTSPRIPPQTVFRKLEAIFHAPALAVHLKDAQPLFLARNLPIRQQQPGIQLRIQQANFDQPHNPCDFFPFALASHVAGIGQPDRTSPDLGLTF